MAATKTHTRPAWLRGMDADQINFYLGLEPEQVVCRGRRRHKFADLMPGELDGKGVEIERVSGIYEVTQHCERGCGRWVRYLTDRQGVIDYSTAHYGGGGPNYLATGLGLTAADDRSHLAHIQAETVRELFKLMAKRAARPAEQVSA